MKEAEIMINGTKLDTAQSLTIRVSLECFMSDLSENGLGEDQHGKHMTEMYTNRINEIRSLIHERN